MFSIPLLPGLEMYLGERESSFLSAMPGLAQCCVVLPEADKAHHQA